MSKLDRFHAAQQGSAPGLPRFTQALKEICSGSKKSHWIWYILPQLKKLGFSPAAKHYGIADAQEACDYLRDKKLFDNYFTIIQEIKKQITHHTIAHVMGAPIDAHKLISSLTLFKEVAAYLDSVQQEPFHDYQGMAQTCNALLKSAAKKQLFVCQDTLSLIRPQLDSMAPPPKVIAVEKDSIIAKPEKVNPTTVRAPKAVASMVSPSITTASTLFNSASKTTDTSAPLPPQKNEVYSGLLQNVKHYIEIRNNEWSFHYNFLGIMSVIYFLHDALWGTDYFNNKSKDLKLSAATKIEAWINSAAPDPLELSPAECRAAQEGRLGELVRKHGGVDSLQESQTTANTVQVKM